MLFQTGLENLTYMNTYEIAVRPLLGQTVALMNGTQVLARYTFDGGAGVFEAK